MFGHFVLVIKHAITSKFGVLKWEELLRKVGLNRDEFDDQGQYDERLVQALVDNAPSVCNCKKEMFMKALGEGYLHRLQACGHNQLLRLQGASFLEFVENIDFIHTVAQARYPKACIPNFRVDEDSSGTKVKLHYYSRRDSYALMVEALLIGIGREYFKKNISIKIISDTEESVGRTERRRHIVYAMDVSDIPHSSDAPPTLVAQTRKHGEHQIVEHDVEEQRHKIEALKEQFGEDALPVNKARNTKVKWRAAIHMSTLFAKGAPYIPRTLSIGPKEFCEVFPYHVVFDEKMQLRQAGVQIQGIVPDFQKENTYVSQYMDLIHPSFMDFSYSNIQKFIDCPHVVKIEQNKLFKDYNQKHRPLYLRGQMLELKDKHLMLYLCSPYVASLNDLDANALHISDIPTHDVTKYLLSGSGISEGDWLEGFLGSGGKAIGMGERGVKNKEEKPHRYAMVPRGIAELMRDGQAVEGKLYKNVTVLFCDIVNFGHAVETCRPNVIVHMLNELHDRFDRLSDVHDVFKVDVIGDAYVIVGGIPREGSDHAESVANMGLAMMYTSRMIPCPYNYGGHIGQRCLVRIGINTGPVIGGVIGHHIPRFTVMGETVILASRLESHGVPDRIHISASTYKELRGRHFELEERGTIELRGKGRCFTYFLVSNRDVPEEMLLGRAHGPEAVYVEVKGVNPQYSNQKIAGRSSRKIAPDARSTSSNELLPYAFPS